MRRVHGHIPAHVHGSTNGYDNYGCRCPLCKDAKRARMKRYRKRVAMRRIREGREA